MKEKTGEILPPIRKEGREIQMTTVRPPAVGGIAARLHSYFQTLTVRQQEELFNALERLSEAQERAIKAKVRLELSLVSLEFLEELKEIERERIKAEMRIAKDRIVSDIIKSGQSLHDVIEAARKTLYPDQKQEAKPARRDPKLDDLDAALSGGGKYSQYVDEQVDALIKKRGGKEHLTEEDNEQIRNAYRKAAGHDEGRG